MNQELEVRVTPLISKIQIKLTVEQYWAFQDAVVMAESFETLPENIQTIITEAEGTKL